MSEDTTDFVNMVLNSLLNTTILYWIINYFIREYATLTVLEIKWWEIYIAMVALATICEVIGKGFGSGIKRHLKD